MLNNTKAFPKEFYSEAIIYRAIQDYRPLAQIALQQDEKNYICTFSEGKVAIERIICEFDNYLIELMNLAMVGVD